MLKKLKFILTKSEKERLVFLFTGTIFLALLETFSIGIIIPIMGLFVNPDKIYMSKAARLLYGLNVAGGKSGFLAMLITVAMLLFIFKALFSVFILYKQKSIVTKMQVRLTSGLLTSYLEKPYAFHLDDNSAVLFRNITSSVANFCSNFLQSAVAMGVDIIILLAIFTLLIAVYPVVTLLLGVIFTILIVLVNVFLKKRIMLYSTERMEGSTKMHKFGLEALQGVKEIKAYDAKDFFVRKYTEVTKNYVNNVLKFQVVSDLPRHLLELTLAILVLTALLLGLYFYSNISRIIPMMMAFGFAALRILPIVNRVYLNVNRIRFYTNSADIVYNTLMEDSLKEIPERKDTFKYYDIFRESHDIGLNNVRFQYSKAPSAIFNNLNLLIPRHKVVAVVGETGAGKSTLIDILMGLLFPSAGRLCYGKVSINSDNISEYRKKIGYVPQNVFLIDDTIEANIAFGIPSDKIGHERIREVVKTAQLESLINSLPAGVKTIVGERGIRLSGGQKQRLAIARALYRNPEILIMDEATSALDAYTEAELSKAIRNLEGKITVIIIAHRLSTIEHADIIYVMDKGKIVDSGSFEELAKNSTVFKKIANRIE